MNIDVLIVKKKLDKDLSSGIKEFEKRLSRNCKIKIENFKTEAALLSKIKSNDFVYSIIPGNSVSSEEFSQWIENSQMKTSKLTFVIGLDHFNERSLSKMSFSEDMTALILIEQIYRAFRIMNNEPYHK